MNRSSKQASQVVGSKVCRQAPERPAESVAARLVRLRSEQASGSRPRFSSLPPQTSSSTSRWLESVTAAERPAPPRPVDRRRGIAGPPPPPSWQAAAASVRIDPSQAVDGRNRQGTWLKPHELVEREKLASRLKGRAKPKEGPVDLFAAAGRVVADDISRGSGSILLEHVAFLPNHLRIRLLDVFADWRNPSPLTDDGLKQLLRRDVSDGAELSLEELEARMDSLAVDDTEDEIESDWETAHGKETNSLDALDSLDLSFSAVSLRTLRQVLLYDSHATASTQPSRPSIPSLPPAPPKLVPSFPNLHTLNLTSTSRIPFSDTFFDLLPYLISLRSLSLAGKSIETSSSTVTSSSFLPRLAAATPTLRELDVSYMDFPHVAVKSVDWDVRWLELRVLGMRREWVDWEGEEVGPEKRERMRREVWDFISQGRQKKRRWIEVIV
ncbi:hypothetical protein OF846_002205 [Rhodotorula toruloides]|nr:hypothetical protein OF846_002205 [Rhodotorula toruloides]